MPEKKYHLKGDEIKKLIPEMGGCISTDRITIDGEPVFFMYRAEPNNDLDSGWQFFSGTEDQDYLNNPDNSAIYSVNTIANYDPAIIPYLDLPYGIELERIEGTDKFQVIPG